MKKGDRVSVLDEAITGVIIAVKNDIITIESTDGFPFDYRASELVVIADDQAEMAKFSDIFNEAMIEKQSNEKKKQSPFKTDLQKDTPPMEVDLHIHQLTPSTRGMDNYDKLNLQMDTAKQKLEFAIRNRMQRVVFIHGVGEGVLKTELEFLFKNYPVKWYAASFKKYGLGATEVYIFQNPKNRN